MVAYLIPSSLHSSLHPSGSRWRETLNRRSESRKSFLKQPWSFRLIRSAIQSICRQTFLFVPKSIQNSPIGKAFLRFWKLLFSGFQYHSFPIVLPDVQKLSHSSGTTVARYCVRLAPSDAGKLKSSSFPPWVLHVSSAFLQESLSLWRYKHFVALTFPHTGKSGERWKVWFCWPVNLGINCLFRLKISADK